MTEQTGQTPPRRPHAEGTRPGGAENRTRDHQPTVPLPPTPPLRPQTSLPPRNRARRRSYFPPWWALLFTVLAVLVCVGGVVALFVALGGRVPPASPPRLVVLTADPALFSQPGETVLMTATFPPEFVPQVQPPGAYVMQGPTLPPPNITPTAEPLDVGRTVVVVAVGVQQLNVRDQPGVIGTSVAFRAPEGSRFTVTDGPQLVDGLSWWRIRETGSSARSGWAAANYLQVVPAD